MVARETFNLLPGHGEPKVTRHGAAEFLPRGLFGFKNDSPSFCSRTFKNDNACSGSCTLHAKISMFSIFIATSQTFVHHGTDGVRQGLVVGIECEAASNILVSKS